MNWKEQKGFTLIELVMVIVILGVLAATALPKFANMQVDAKVAALQGAMGAVNSAIAIAHSEALLKSKQAATGETISLEGSTVTLAYGYPTADAAGIQAAINLSSDFTLAAPATATTPASFQVKHAKATDPTTCYFTYTQAASLTTIPVVSSSTTSGC